MAARHERRDAARRLVEAYALAAVERWAAAEPAAWATLQRVLYDPEPLLRWRAAEALGRVAAVRAREDVGAVRDLCRRTLWLMSDESGGVLWLGPQVLGATLAGVPALCGELLPVLASFLEKEPFRAGTRWALWRVALARPLAVADTAADALAASLADPDPDVRGHAALAHATATDPAVACALADDPAPLVVFDPVSGRFRATTVGAAAAGAP